MTGRILNRRMLPVAVAVMVSLVAGVLALWSTIEPISQSVAIAVLAAMACVLILAVVIVIRGDRIEALRQSAYVREANAQTATLSNLNQKLAVQSREIAKQALQLAQQRDGYKSLARSMADKQAWIDTVLTQLPAGVLLVDSDLNVVSRNERFRELLGLPAGSPPPKSLTDFNGWPATTTDGKPIIFQDWPLVRALRDGLVVHDVEMRVGQHQGGWFHAVVSASPIRSPAGEVLGGVLLINDISVRQQSEERLRLLESAVVHANDAIIVLEAFSASGKGRSVKYVNEAFTLLTGYTSQDVLGRSLHFLKGANSDAKTLEELRVALDAAKPFRTELLNYRKDGRPVWVDLSLVPVQGPDGRCTHYIMIQRDITDRKIAEGSLRESEALFRGIFESTSAGVSITDETGRFVSCNPAFAELVGRTVSQVLMHTPGDLTHPDDWSNQVPLMQAAKSGQQPRYQYPKRYLKPDGTVVWAELTFAGIYDSDGNYQYGLGVSVDVTARRTLEEQLRQSQKMEALGQLAGGIAHDFNNLLTAVLGNLALMKLPEQDPNRDLLGTVEQAATRAAELTRKLLGYARRNQLLVAPVPPSALLDEVTAILRRTFDPRIEIVVKPGPDGLVAADATLIHQALMNLCLNARDAMPDGGILTLAAETVELHADDLPSPDARPGSFTRISVCDSGTGIDDAIRERLFEPFFTTKGVGKGTGLGLPMVHGIMRQHDGWVTLDSVPGRGSTFALYLPTIAALPAPTAKTGFAMPKSLSDPDFSIMIETPLPAQTATILLVDDEDMIRMLGRSVLESAGYKVLCAADGVEGLEIFSGQPSAIDLVILDLTMPRLSGKDTYQRLVAIDPDATVLFSSGYSAEDISDLDTSARLLSKPYRPNDLLAAVRRSLNRSREPVVV
jgi:two-component system, cell cycle sensor histidine kinase and response regulator CckA